MPGCKQNKFNSSIWFSLSISILSLSVCLVIGEIIVRVFHMSKTYDSYPWQVRQAQCNISYSPEKNSLGWRDHEYSRDKKAGAFRIACVGDSVTEGYRIKLENTFTKLLEASLKSAGIKAEVMNLGSCGHATEENLASLEKALEFLPDLIVYQFGLNDIKELEYYKESMGIGVRDSGDKPGRMHKFSLKSILRRSALYCAIAERYNYVKLRMGSKNWSFNKWYASDKMWENELNKFRYVFSKINNSTKIIILNMPYDFQVYSDRPEVNIASRKIGKFCQDNGYGFLDFTQILKQQRGAYGIFLDDCHLSERGHKIVADYLKRFILSHYGSFARI